MWNTEVIGLNRLELERLECISYYWHNFILSLITSFLSEDQKLIYKKRRCARLHVPEPFLASTIMRLCRRELRVGVWRPDSAGEAMFCGTVVLRQLACEGLLMRSMGRAAQPPWLWLVPTVVRLPTDSAPLLCRLWNKYKGCFGGLH